MSNVVSLDGVANYVNCGHNASLNLITNLTLCCRIKFADFKSYCSLVSKISGLLLTNAQYSIFAQVTTGEIRAVINDGVNSNFIASAYIIKLNRWSHMVMVVSAGFIKLYVDGAKICADTVRTVNPQSQPNWDVFVGGSNLLGYAQNKVSEAQIYDRDLSDDEVLYNYMHPNNPKRRGLVLNLTQDSIYGPTWLDLSGNANNGTYVGGAVPVTNNRLAGR